jgi:hypothetical protein
MNIGQRRPPRLALWLLRHLCRGQHAEALTGDLVERLLEGATPGWFWRQTLAALIACALSGIRNRWIFFAYAAAGTGAMCSVGQNTHIPIATWLHWSDLPWPFSQLVFELSMPALIALTALSVLTAGLLIEHSFRWASLIRTGIVNVALTILGRYSIDIFPWLLRPIPGDPYHKVLIVPGVLQILLLFSTFVVAAWVGCPLVGVHDRSKRARARP